ncbi:MAG: hypothetical protein ACD_75C00595G0002 [uncultured bacterium]|nr:MAG: hypothetical protein ACD_75C00595G0002 [uncultured bacterium]
MPSRSRRIKKLGLFLPKTNPFYLGMFWAIKRGLEQAGIEVSGWTELLDERSLLTFCREFKPDAVFEMNRSRRQIPWFPKHIVHIGWIVDLGSRDQNEFGDSEILYFFNRDWLGHYTVPHSGFVDWLPPAFCPTINSPKKQQILSDFSFVGHISNPWDDKEYSRIVYKDDTTSITFKEIEFLFSEYWNSTRTFTTSYLAIETNQSLNPAIKQNIIKSLQSDPILKYDTHCRLVRMYNRQRLINCCLGFSNSLRLYGTNWHRWPIYAPYYRSFIEDPRELTTIFQTSAINLHEGVPLHMRVFECLGSGGFLMYFIPQGVNFAASQMHELLEEGTHYMAVAESDFEESASYVLKNFSYRDSVIKSATQLVHAEHTWRDRVHKILQDCRSVL